MKPIQFVYRNIKFRSKLEARWAVFFDAMGIDWIYEPETYDLGDDLFYCPDFLLPTFDGGCFIEVKYASYEPTEYDLNRWTKLDKKLIKCFGVPDTKFYFGYCSEFKQEFEYGFLIDQAEGENRFFVEPGYTDKYGFVEKEMMDIFHERYYQAIWLSRKIRYDTVDEVIEEIRILRKEPNKIPY